MRSPYIRIGLQALPLAGFLAASPLLQDRGRSWPHGHAHPIQVVGHSADVALGDDGLAVFAVSNSTHCARIDGDDTRSAAGQLAVAAAPIDVADNDAGLSALSTLAKEQFGVRVFVKAGVPFTIEATTNLTPPVAWSPLITTNIPTMQFEFVDFDVKSSEKPQKYYRVRQP